MKTNMLLLSFCFSWGYAGELPELPVAAVDLVSAIPFQLEKPYNHDWRAERPLVSSGFILVIAVDGELVRPRQVAEPVLYVGKQTAERVNFGHESGMVIAFVPGLSESELKTAPIWFGDADLPERITAAKSDAQLTQARASGIQAFPQTRIDEALTQGGGSIIVKDKRELLREAAQLILFYSPGEKELAARFLQ